MAHHRRADAGAPPVGPHPHALDLRPPGALAGQAGDEGELERAHDPAVRLRHDQMLVRLRHHRMEGVEIALVQRHGKVLALRAQRIVGQHDDDGRQVGGGGFAEGERHAASLIVWSMARKAWTSAVGSGLSAETPISAIMVEIGTKPR